MGRANDLLERDKKRGSSHPETRRKGHLLRMELYGVGSKARVWNDEDPASASWWKPKRHDLYGGGEEMMDNLLQNIAASLWIVVGIQFLVWLKKWNKKFRDLYDELKEDENDD